MSEWMNEPFTNGDAISLMIGIIVGGFLGWYVIAPLLHSFLRRKE